jgi:hypothetical protein
MAILLPELLAMLSSDLFLMLSLLTCLLEDRFPKTMPYIYQIAALMGFGNLLVSKVFLGVFDEYMRFWYSFFYLGVGLANIIAVNVYLAVSKKMWNLAKIWSVGVTFPATFISIVFIYNYAYLQETGLPPLMLPSLLVLSIAMLALALGALLGPRLRSLGLRR